MKVNLFLVKSWQQVLSILCALLFPFISFSQSNNTERIIDSLELILPIESGVERLSILNSLSFYTKSIDLKKGLSYARLLETEIQFNEDSELKSNAYCTLAEVYNQTGVSTDSIKIMAELCLDLGIKFDNQKAQLNALYRLGNYHKIKAEFETAIEYYIKGIELGDPNKPNKIKGNCLHGIGVIKDFQKEYAAAIVYFNKSIKNGHEINSNDAIFNGLQSRAIVKFHEGKNQEGILDFLEAKKYADKLSNKIDIRSNLSYAYTIENKIDSAKYYLKEAYKICNEFGANRQIINTSSSLIGLHLELNEWDEVYPLLLEREKLIEERKSKKWLRTSSQDFTKYYKATGDFKQAFKYQEKYITYNDSILNEKNQFAVKELEEKYENEKNQIVIGKQRNEIENKKTQRNLFLVIGLLGITFLFHRITKNKQLEKQRTIIKQKEIEKLKKENTILNLSSMLEGQQIERKRIAQDLHDGLGGLLSSAKYQLEIVKKEVAKLEGMDVFSSTEKLIENAYKEVRRISHDMMPGALEKLGLFAAVEDLADQLNESEKTLVRPQWFTTDHEMNDKTKISLFLIIQEAATNVMKYSQATNLIIQLSRSNNFYQLTIEDNGIGFDYNDESKHGIGLKNIKSRVNYLEGEIDILTKPGEGVSIEISIPIPDNTNMT